MENTVLAKSVASVMEYCVPFTTVCRSMAEWGVYWQAIGVVATLVFGTVGLYKIFHELKRTNEIRGKELQDRDIAAKLKRTEFFLSQHRRLFDDADLSEVLCLLDGDKIELVEECMWDKKRKFLTFIEEMALLVKSGHMTKSVALYMFGYYAVCARKGPNFNVGIAQLDLYWALFYEFSRDAESYLSSQASPPTHLSL